jgi:hypothetical protein
VCLELNSDTVYLRRAVDHEGGAAERFGARIGEGRAAVTFIEKAPLPAV